MTESKTRFQEDCEYGIQKEIESLKYINDFFKCDITRSSYEYAVFDFSDDKANIYAELKSRKCNKDAYPTTMVGANKCRAGKKLIAKGYDVYFCFRFSDGIYYYEYNDEMLDWIELFKRNKRSGYEDKLKEYSFIPIEKLKLLVSFKKKTLKRTKKYRLLPNGLVQMCKE